MKFREAFRGVLYLTVLFFVAAVALKIIDSPDNPMGDVIDSCFSLVQIGFGGMVGLIGGKATTAVGDSPENSQQNNEVSS